MRCAAGSPHRAVPHKKGERVVSQTFMIRLTVGCAGTISMVVRADTLLDAADLSILLGAWTA